MKNHILILSTFLLLSCTDVGKTIDEISNHNMMESEYVGFGGSESDEFKRFQKIKSIATDEELIKLLNHKNAIVRTYGFLGLIEREKMKSSEAFEKALETNDSFSKMIADQILESDICTEIYFDIINRTSKTDQQIRAIDSIIIYKIDSTHFLHRMALKDKKYQSKFDSRVRDLAEKYRNEEAIFYLDKHAIEIDTTKILESIKYIVEHKFVGNDAKNRLIELRSKLKRIENDNQ